MPVDARCMVQRIMGPNVVRPHPGVLYSELICQDDEWLIFVTPRLADLPADLNETIAHQLVAWSYRHERGPSALDIDRIVAAILLPKESFLELIKIVGFDYDRFSYAFGVTDRILNIRAAEFETATESGVFPRVSDARIPIVASA